VYGTLFADQLRFNLARTGALAIDNNLEVAKYAAIQSGLAVGTMPDSMTKLETLQASHPGSDPIIKIYVKGGVQGTKIVAESEAMDSNSLGDVYLRHQQYRNQMYARIGGTVGSSTLPFGLHLTDTRNSSAVLNTFVMDYQSGAGVTGQVTLDVRGDIKASRGLLAPYIAGGNTTTTNTDYPLFIVGAGYVSGEMRVGSIRFVGSEALSGDSDIITPPNADIVDNATKTLTIVSPPTDQAILRHKDFSLFQNIHPNNQDKLGVPGYTAPNDDYYDYMATVPEPSRRAFFGHDTLSFLENEFNAIVGTTVNDIYVDQITDDDKKRYNFGRINVCTLGQLTITWIGYAYDPYPGHYDPQNVIQSYIFESNYFRNKNGDATIDWMPVTRYGDENYIAHVEANIVDTHPSVPAIYSIEANVGIYLPKSNWWGYRNADPAVQPNPDYASFALYYPVEKVISSFNYFNLTMQTTTSGGYTPSAEWRLALYPRLVQQTRLPYTAQTKMYRGIYDLDLVLFPVSIGRCSNLTGKLYISCMQ